MIRADFKKKNGNLTGFGIKGHSGYAQSGSDIVCAAVSSAVQLVVNILDSLELSPNVNVEENCIKCSVSSDNRESAAILETFREHLESVGEEFPGTIKITISEV